MDNKVSTVSNLKENKMNTPKHTLGLKELALGLGLALLVSTVRS